MKERQREQFSQRSRPCVFGIEPCRLPAQQGHWTTIKWTHEPILPESFLNLEFRVIHHVTAALSFQHEGDSCPKSRCGTHTERKQRWIFYNHEHGTLKWFKAKNLENALAIMLLIAWKVSQSNLRQMFLWRAFSFDPLVAKRAGLISLFWKTIIRRLPAFAPSGRGARFLFHREPSRSAIWDVVEVQSKMENAWNARRAQLALVAPSL